MTASSRQSATSQPVRHQSRRVTIVGGTVARLSDQTRLLLRTRLRVVGTLVLIGSSLFLIWGAITGNLNFRGTEAVISWLHVAMALAVSWASIELWRPRLMGWRGLRTAELVIFGAPSFLILAVQYLQMTKPDALTAVPVSTGAWCALLYTYGMFIPNSWRRAARILTIMAIAPVLLSAAAWRQMQNPPPSFWEDLSGVALLLLISAGVATYGTHIINALRRQAFEARQLGQYRLRELLGSGGMGDIYLAEHQLLKRPCAIKLIDPGKSADPRSQARFEREVRATAQLSHWNTVEIFDYGRTDDGTFYYVMEYLPGLTLSELVERHGPLPPERAVHFLRQACAALAEAHRQGLIHRDIKPGNIIAAYRGGQYDVGKLVDFGLVQLAAEAGGGWNPQTNLAGSPLYMAPEQALGGTEPDARSDIYALGGVAYFLLTGRPPFEGSKPLKVVIAHAHDPVIPPSRLQPDVPPDLESIILKCLAKDPEDRFISAEQLEHALEEVPLAESWTPARAREWWESFEPETLAAATTASSLSAFAR